MYADVMKKLGQAASILSDSFSPTVAVALVDRFLTMINVQAGRAGATTTGDRREALAADPGAVCLPDMRRTIIKDGVTHDVVHPTRCSLPLLYKLHCFTATKESQSLLRCPFAAIMVREVLI